MSHEEQGPKVVSRRKFLNAAATAAGAFALAACGQSSTGSGSAGGAAATAGAGGASGGGAATGATTGAAGGGGGGASGVSGVAIKWSTWGNPGELERFKQFTADYNKRTGAKAELIPQPSDYEAKLLTQLSGGTAPDVFYSGDTTLAKLIQSKTIVELTSLLSGPNSKSKPEDFYPGLWGPAKTADGKIWGVPVDCNPMVFWYNKKLLQDAGITTMPADLQKQNKWTWQAFQDMCKAVVAKGKRGFIQENWFGAIFGWVTTNGGKVWDGEKFVANEDPKAKEGFQFIQDNLKNKNFTYSGSLPKGQGISAMFLSQQAAFVAEGRWDLPQYKKATGLEFDIVPWPTNTGKAVEPAGIPTAYMVLNAKAANPDAAFAFLTDFVSKEGQIFRLKGGGNAIPAIKGADEVVAEGNLPANWKALIDAREIGYAIWPALANYAGLADDMFKTLDEAWLKGGDMNTTLNKISDIVKKKKGQA